MAAIATSFSAKGSSGNQGILDSIAKNQEELISVIREQGKQQSESMEKLGEMLGKQQSESMLQLGTMLIGALKKD